MISCEPQAVSQVKFIFKKSLERNRYINGFFFFLMPSVSSLNTYGSDINVLGKKGRFVIIHSNFPGMVSQIMFAFSDGFFFPQYFPFIVMNLVPRLYAFLCISGDRMEYWKNLDQQVQVRQRREFLSFFFFSVYKG